MKSKINLIISISILAFVALACSGSFTTANISSFNFGKNDKADPPTTTFDIKDKIYAVATVSNTSSKHKMNFKIIYENVQGKTKGEEAYKQDIEFEGSRPVFLYFNVPAPGDYKVEATLLGEDGKQIDQKSGSVKVTGSAPAATTDAPKKDNDADADDK
ncbi:MAG TPA: hypothetical protein PKY59_26225 [Pyrinomonadaceae bacterium]|nr:hypothetical protein [Pyrinomonadaceae bacterium]